MMNMNMPLAGEKVTFRATLFGLVKTALNIGCPGESLSLHYSPELVGATYTRKYFLLHVFKACTCTHMHVHT